MKEDTISVGQVVQSKAGRDKGRFFIVIDLPDEAHALIVDGGLRKINRPKRKKLKHLTCKPVVNQDIMKRLDQSEPVYDQDICQALKGFSMIEEEETCQNKM